MKWKEVICIMASATVGAAWSWSPAVAADPPAEGVSASVVKIDLKTAMKYAVENNFEIVALRKAVAAAEAGVNATRAAWYPRFGLAGGVDSLSYANTEESASVGYAYASWNLFNGFRERHRGRIADLERSAALVRLQTAEFNVGLEVEEQFYAFLFASSRLDLKRQAQKLNESHRRVVTRTLRSGLVSKTGVMEVDLKDSLLRSEIVSLELELEERRLELKRLFGSTLGERIEPVGTLPIEGLAVKFGEFSDMFLTKIPQVRLASTARSLAEEETGLERASWMPKIDLEARAGHLPILERPSADDPAVSVLLLAKIDLFSGFDSYFGHRKRFEEAAAAEMNLKQRILEAVTTAESRWRALEALHSKVLIEADNVELATKYYKAVLGEFERGYRSAPELSAATEAMFTAQQKTFEYKFEFIRGRLELARITGVAVPVTVLADGKER